MSDTTPATPKLAESKGFVQRTVEIFLRGNLSPMLIVISLLAGAVALLVTPREEEPQIVVPLADLFVEVPGASAEEVERQVTSRLEKLLYQIDGVEYVYSMSKPNRAIVTVRFYVGEDREDSLVKLQTKLAMHSDEIPANVAGWAIKPVEIDDVPIVNVALYAKGESADDVDLRRIAEELELQLQAVQNTGRTNIVGGRAEQVRVKVDAEKLSGRGLSIADLSRALAAGNIHLPAGQIQQQSEEIVLETGKALISVEDVEQLVVGVADGSPVYMRDVATVSYEPAEVETYTQLGFNAQEDPSLHPAVTIAVAKRKGSNAVWVADRVEERVKELVPVLLPDGVEYRITRNYGETADHKVNELVEALAVAIVIVVGLLALVMGWREALVVALAVPLTFALTLLINYLTGYSINRVTLFALILALGLVVDDPIVDVENIHRHLKMRLQKPMDAVLTAVNEVRPPIIMATLAVIVSFVPMFFITGMMGPYMRPMALNVPLAMLMSLIVAFTVTPWLAYHALKNHQPHTEDDQPYDLHRTAIYRIYAAITRPLLRSNRKALLMLGMVGMLFIASCLLAMFRLVPLKMLPFDNKTELQVIVNMPETATLEMTQAAVQDIAQYMQKQNEVTDVTTFTGTASPMDFNGMVRHYYLRQGPNVGDVRINLVGKRERVHQSHEIAMRVRHDLEAIAARHDAKLQIVELPPGPPVISTLTVEVYGQLYHNYADLQAAAEKVALLFEQEPGIEDVDTSAEANQRKVVFVVDKEKASMSGLQTLDIAHQLSSAVKGEIAGHLHQSEEVNAPEIEIRLAEGDRNDLSRLERLYITTSSGVPVQLGELGRFQEDVVEQTIYHKNLQRVAYVFAETVGITPAEAILATIGDLSSGSQSGLIPEDIELHWAGEGEWKITVDVFRDLGLAFAAACIGIYILLVYETDSYFMPLVLMISIPLTVIGIMPGFWVLNLLWDTPVGGFGNPVFFTATAMIGMIALSGIAVRNAILLIDFIHVAQKQGMGLQQAILDSGAVRMKPIFLTTSTAMLAAVPITLDPIFSGLAWSLIFGLLVSTAFTLVVVPVVYWLVYGKKAEQQPA